jgi:serine kinase of HPr protein (carbohydrate metabolism regulator)
MRGPGGSVHGTAFLLGDIGLIVLGPSGAGKSQLAAGLASGWLGTGFRLVADDRVWLTAAGGRLIARPTAGFLGKIEIRGLGISDLPGIPSAILRGMVRLIPAEPERMPDQAIENEELFGVSLPSLRVRSGADCAMRFQIKWPHFRDYIQRR